MSLSKRRKLDTECRVFQEKWTENYLFTEVKTKAVCLVCNQQVSVLKEYNIRCHYETLHKEKYHHLKGQLRKEEVGKLWVGLMKQQSTFTFSSEVSDAAVRTSFLISHEIVQKMQLCCKALKMHHEMSVIVKTVNFIIARGLNHRPFDLFSEIKTFRLAYHTTLKYGG